MFDSICDTGAELDLGALAEAMIFYQRVHLVLSYGRLSELVSALGTRRLVALLDAGHLEASYTNVMVVAHSADGPKGRIHDVVCARLPDHDLEKAIPALVHADMGSRGPSAERCVNKLLRAIRPLDIPTHLTEAARNDLTNGPLVRGALRDLAAMLAPGLDATSFRFEINRDSHGLHVESNVDFGKFGGAGGLAVFTEAHLIATFGTARMHAHAAATLGGEIATNETTSIVLRSTVADLARRSGKSMEGIAGFQELVLDEAGAIRDAINSGRRSFADVEGILERAHEFRTWLKNQPPERKLVKAYYDEVTKDTWVASEPGKAARWFLLTALGLVAGLVGEAPGVVLSGALCLADTFLLERMAKGWRPDQFVNGALKGFVGRED